MSDAVLSTEEVQCIAWRDPQLGGGTGQSCPPRQRGPLLHPGGDVSLEEVLNFKLTAAWQTWDG